MIQIVPTILEKEFLIAQEKINLARNYFKWIQIDVIDGNYTLGKTFELELLNKISFDTSNLLWNIHLMVANPIKWVEKCIFVGASKIIGQVEMMDNVDEFVNEVKNNGMEAGLGFDIDTEINEIPDEVDEILLMGRKAGFEPQEFEVKVVNKIKQLLELKKEKDLRFKISVDGGINISNLNLIKESDIAYCGNAIFKGIVEDNIKEINKTLNE
jgi:ribulose-phosphate 3-epimerase